MIRALSAENLFQAPVEFYSAQAKDRPRDLTYQRRRARSYFYFTVVAMTHHGAEGVETVLTAARRGVAVYDELRRADAANGADAVYEAQLCIFTATWLFLVAERPDEAATWCAKVLAVLDAAPVGASQPAARLLRRDSHLVRAILRGRQGHSLDALADFSAAFALEPAAREGTIGNYYAQIVVAARRRLLVDLLRQHRDKEAVAEAETLASIPNIPGEALYDAACVFGVLAGAAREAAVREQHAARCVALLRRAHAAGFGKDSVQKETGLRGDPVQLMEHDEDLAAVRARADYHKLVADLSGRR
jgi:hypothetical protein